MDSRQDSQVGNGYVEITGNVDHEEITQRVVRADMYRFLAGCFRYPATDIALTNQSVLALGLGQVEAIPGPVRDLLRRAARILERNDGEEIRGEYERLFGMNPLCSPYETAYCPTRKERILGDLAGFYRAFGLIPAAARPDMPDHICAEMEFLSVVLLKAAYGLRRGAREMSDICLHAHQSFLADHVGRWYETFSETAGTRTDLDLFRSQAELLRAWVETDLRLSRVSAVPYGAESSLPLQGSNEECPLVS